MKNVFGGYVALAVVMTWPLVLGMHRDVPGDLGDSLLNLWILGWGAENVPRLLAGQISLSDYWNANIFHPEPLVLSLSEHLFGQVIQIIPVYWLTGNLIFAYNLLFISSFALSGLGMYLLVRDLLSQGDERGFSLPAFIAGLIFAFLPFRIAQVAHIQSLSAQWMPLALYGFVRYIRSGDWRWLAGGSLSLLMQNWSCGYYLIFFAPFVPIFVIHQMWTTGRWRNGRMWMAFMAAAALVVAGTWPFLALYLEAQRVHGFERSVGEVIRYSADVYSYLTAPETLRVWGRVMQAYPKPEGELFFGIVPWLLVGSTIVWLARLARPTIDLTRRRPPAIWRTVTWILIALLTIQILGLLAILLTGGFITSLAGVPIRATNPLRILTGIAIASVLLLAVSSSARRRLRGTVRSPAGFCLILMVLAMWLSLGPVVQSRGETLAHLGLYDVLYQYVPGFAGLRVPARYAMVAAVFLSVVAGFGAAALLDRVRAATVAGVVIAVAFAAEVAFVPMPLNLTWADGAVVPPPRVEPAADAPPVYHQLAVLPPSTVVAEFPFGEPEWELRYVYYATVHWKRLVNGYSGAFPHEYKVRVALLQRISENPDEAWRALREAGTTHVVVHQAAFAAGEAAVVTRWLDDHFAIEIARFGTDLLYDVTGVWPPA